MTIVTITVKSTVEQFIVIFLKLSTVNNSFHLPFVELIKHEEYDVVVVGSGVGGLVAAHHGLNAVIIEKANVWGGSSDLSGGGFRELLQVVGMNLTGFKYNPSAQATSVAC